MYPIRHIALEYRYKPNLGVYSVMDSIGSHFSDDFPEWQRSALSLDIRNRKLHQRFLMAHKRCFYQCIDPRDSDVRGEIERVRPLFDRFTAAINVTAIERVGLRQWFAFPKEDSFKDLVKVAKQKFHPNDSQLQSVLQGDTSDVGFTAVISMPDGWKYNISAGPMEKEQWFSFVPQDPSATFASPSEYDEYRKSFPERFLYVDMDCFKEGETMCNLPFWMVSVCATSRSVVEGLNKFFEEG